MELGLDLKLRSWSWNWSWSWYSGDLPDLELELELKPPELELIFWRFAGVGIGVGVETSGVGVGVDILEIGRSWSWSWNLWSWSWSWYYGVDPNPDLEWCRWAGAIKWVLEPFLAARHYDAPQYGWFLCSPFPADTRCNSFVYTSGHCRRWRSCMEVKIMAGSLFVHCKIAYFYSVTAEKWLIVSLPNVVMIRRTHFSISC